MRIFVDIDATIAMIDPAHYFRVLNSSLQLGYSGDDLRAMEWKRFFEHPALIARMGEVGSEHHQHMLRLLHLEPAILSGDIPIPGSVERLQQLHHDGHLIAYATARFIAAGSEADEAWREQIKKQNAAIAHATMSWLAQWKYPRSARTHICAHEQEKLAVVAETLLLPVAGQAMLIDDRYEACIEAWNHLKSEQQEVLAKKLTLVAYGAEKNDVVRLRNPFRMIVALCSWEQADQILFDLQERAVT